MRPDGATRTDETRTIDVRVTPVAGGRWRTNHHIKGIIESRYRTCNVQLLESRTGWLTQSQQILRSGLNLARHDARPTQPKQSPLRIQREDRP